MSAAGRPGGGEEPVAPRSTPAWSAQEGAQGQESTREGWGRAPEDLTCPGVLDAFRLRLEAAEERIAAFVDEPARFARIASEVARLASGPASPKLRLRGAPLGVKDVFHVDGLPTRAGSRLPPEELAGPQGTAVGRLRAAGAVVVGKTASTEFAYFAPAATRNPHHPEHTPGGSSSGSAAAVAAGQCVLALGTQTIGSVGRPASFCGVVGFKPSYDRIPRDGLIPLAPSLDHVGVFAPDVAWARRAAAVLCDDWDADAAGAVAAGPDDASPDEDVAAAGLRCSPCRKARTSTP